MPRKATRKNRLTPRDREILRDVVTRYIVTGEPVGSRSVAKSQRHGLSAASIRNVMADLEDMGFLSHPHTSAGRVPTEEGYHFYIDSLMPNRSVPARARRYIEECLGEQRGDGEALMSSATQILSELSHQIGIVLTPAISETVVRTINFLELSDRKVLCVVVSTSGFVDHKVIETEEKLPASELQRISNYLTETFGGRSLREIRNELLRRMGEERAKVDRLLARAISLAGQALQTSQDPDLIFEGTTTLLGHPQLTDVGRVRTLLDTFADKAGLVNMLNRLIDGPGVRVVIGDESDLTSDLDFSLVATTYGAGSASGTLGVFGPSRMDYQKMVPLVDFFGDRLSRALESVYSHDS